MKCYDCGNSGTIEGSDGNHYCERCWNGEPRTIVKAYYNFCSTFVVPTGIQLDTNEWWIKWDTLYIRMKDGTMYSVKPLYSATDGDFKHPYDESIVEETIDDEYDESEYVSKG